MECRARQEMYAFAWKQHAYGTMSDDGSLLCVRDFVWFRTLFTQTKTYTHICRDRLLHCVLFVFRTLCRALRPVAIKHCAANDEQTGRAST